MPYVKGPKCLRKGKSIPAGTPFKVKSSELDDLEKRGFKIVPGEESPEESDEEKTEEEEEGGEESPESPYPGSGSKNRLKQKK